MLNTWNLSGLGAWAIGSPPINVAPTLLMETTTGLTVAAGATIMLSVTPADTAGDTFTYLWSTGETTDEIQFTAPTGPNASVVTTSCTVTDQDGLTGSASLGINVRSSVFIPPSIPQLSVLTAVFWQHSDNFYQYTPSTLDYSNVEYIISDRRGNTLVFLTLGNGIYQTGDDLIVHVDDASLTFRGDYYHQLVLIDSGGNRLPPEFQSKLKVKRVFINA